MSAVPLATVSFRGAIVSWRGPAPYLFVPVPESHVGEIAYAARLASYGWGCVPVEARIGGTDFATSLFPRDGAYLLPVKVAVQKAEGMALGDLLDVEIRVVAR